MLFKKVLAGALAAVVAVGSLSVAAFAEDEALVSGDFEYRVLSDGTVQILYYLGNDENVVIPGTIEGKEVTRVMSFSKNENIVTIEFPDSVTWINDDAFYGCTSLTAIIVGEGNTAYTAVDGVLFSKDLTELLTYPIGKQGAKYSIPDTVVEIGWRAFRGSSLEEIVIPDGVTTIEYEAFYNCKSLAGIVLPDSLTNIYGWAFGRCTSLTEIVIPGSVTTIEYAPFGSCTSLTSIVVDEDNINFSSVDGILFDKDLTALLAYPAGKQGAKYSIPDTVTTIGDSAFVDCNNLEEIVIPNSVTIIDADAFNGCESLKGISIPDSVTKIGSYAFADCVSLSSFDVDENNADFVAVDDVLFDKNVTKLIQYPASKQDVRYSIPDTVTTIETFSFSHCVYLEEIVFPVSVATIKGYAFIECANDLTIYGYTGSAAETYAEGYGMSFVALDEELSDKDTLEDKDTGIEVSAAEGVIPAGAELKVEADKENSSDTSVAFDITITADGKAVDINGNVTVTIPVPEELKGADTYYVFYKADDGTLTDMKAAFKDGVITFTTTHFSTYIVSTVDLLKDKGTPDSGVEGVAIFAGLAIVAAGAVLVAKKRK